MKRLFNLILVATMAVTTVVSTIDTNKFEPTKVYASTNSITVKVDGKNVLFDQPPIMENGRVFVPMRAIFEALGYEVKWDSKIQGVKALLEKENYLIYMNLYNGNQMMLNYKEYITNYTKTGKLDNERLEIETSTNFTNTTTFNPNYKKTNGRILVPVRAISEGTGAKVSWDGATKTVLINSSNPVIINVKTGVKYDVNGAKDRVEDYFNNETTSNNNTNTTVSNSTVNTTMAEQVIEIVNAERKKVGASPLTLSEELNSLAQVKADDMVKNNYFSHTSPTLGSPFDMLKGANITYVTSGENIAEGQQSAEDVMKAWMNSEGHKENILNPKFEELGVGYSLNNGRPIWVQIFIGN